METLQRHTDVWENCLRIIEQIVTPQQYKTWFTPIRPVSLVESTLQVEVPSDFFREYLESAFLDVIRKTMKRVIGTDARLVYLIRPVQNQPQMAIPASTVGVPAGKTITIAAAPENPSPFVYPGLKKITVDPRLNPVYCFDNLIEGECNKMGVAAGVNIAAAPGKTPFNPLFIFGGSGLGKTHLAQAIGLSILQKYPDLVVLYVTGHEFKTQYMEAVTVRNKLTDFLNFYMRMDVLIVDDIQDLVGQGNQNAFFNIFNHLHQNGKQLILTSDRSPAELQNFEARLASRFKWGLSVELTPPDHNTRFNMLRSRCIREGVTIGDDVLEYLATNIRSNFRELEGALISVIAHSTMTGRENSVELAAELTEKIVGHTAGELTIEQVRDTVCDYFNVSVSDIASKSRRHQIVQARQIAMYLCRNLVQRCSLSTIGAEIGGKDHATVVHSCNTVADLMANDRNYRKFITDIEEMLAANC